MGKILIRNDGARFSYDKVLAEDPRFRTVEDTSIQTAQAKSPVVDVNERINPQLQDEMALNDGGKTTKTKVKDEADIMERVDVLLQTIGYTEPVTDICIGLDIVIEKLLNPVPLDDLQEVPVADDQAADVPEEEEDEQEEVQSVPEVENDDMSGDVVPEVENDLDPDEYKKLDDKNELEAWAREHLNLELDKRFGLKKLKKQIADAISDLK